MNDRKIRMLLIIGGIGLFVLGTSIIYHSTDNFPQNLSSAELQEKLKSSNAPIGTGICAVGALACIFGVVWNKIPSRYKPDR